MLQPHLPTPRKRCTNSVQWRSQGALQYCPSLLQNSPSRSLADQKSYIMSYEGLFIAKGVVTLDIPLCHSSTTLMNLHILYDCYIQLLTLELHLALLDVTMRVYSCETTWLEKAKKDIIDTRSTMVRPTLWHSSDGGGGELMPSLVVCDGVHAPHGDILLKWTLASVATSALVQTLHPTHLLTCAWSSWVELNWKHIDV